MFFSVGLFFGLPVFRGSVLSNLQRCFDILSSFWEVCSKVFLCLVNILISAFLRANFSKCSRGFFVGLLLTRFFLSGSVVSSTPYIGLFCLLRMHAINSCVDDARQRL